MQKFLFLNGLLTTENDGWGCSHDSKEGSVDWVIALCIRHDSVLLCMCGVFCKFFYEKENLFDFYDRACCSRCALVYYIPYIIKFGSVVGVLKGVSDVLFLRICTFLFFIYLFFDIILSCFIMNSCFYN